MNTFSVNQSQTIQPFQVFATRNAAFSGIPSSKHDLWVGA
jgi:hypothetical protein